MLAKIIQDTERRVAGLIDDATDQLKRPIADHAEDYRTHLMAKARDEKHIRDTIRHINRIAKECRCRILAELEAGSDALEKYLAGRREQGRSFRTINADLVAVRSFCRWLMDKGRMRKDPTRGLHRLNVEEDRRRERRALSDGEAQMLIDAAYRSTKLFKRLTGKDRAVMYTLAQRTGLRRKELRSLTPASFDFSSNPPTVQVKAGNSKRRKTDTLPLTEDVANTLREYLTGRMPNERVWPGNWWRRSAEMLRMDLAAAKIEPVDAQGRVVNFHGQRTTFITALARAGVSPATSQKLARHSDINLTLGTYTKLEAAELVDAVEKLPDLKPGAEAAARNGKATEPCAVIDPQLNAVITAWPTLPEHIHRAIFALVGIAANPAESVAKK